MRKNPFLVLALLVACGHTNGPLADTFKSELSATLTDKATERYLDIDDRPYPADFVRSFAYPKKGEDRVHVTYESPAPVISGQLRVKGLKPNFAYQIKLLSRGNNPAQQDGFEKIGFLGRWSLPGKGTNFSDDDYRQWPDKSQATAFLLFAFFVSDEKGDAEKDFRIDSSWHVLWHTRQRKVHPHDSASQRDVYAEAEAGRPTQGKALLPPGTYTTELVLTEESFHAERDVKDGGRWATVLSTPMKFVISAPVNDK